MCSVRIEEIGAGETAKQRLHARPPGLVSFSDDLTDESPSRGSCAPTRTVVDPPKHILLINLLTNSPKMTIAGANVDLELVQAPLR
jgi:hypothetical protein